VNYSKSLLLYQDDPAYGILLKLVVLIAPAAFLAASIYLWLSGDTSGSLVLLIEALIVVLIFWGVFPRKYQVYEDRIRVVLGGPFSVNVGFQNVKMIRVTSKLSFTVNFVTRITKSYVEIVKNRGLSVAITPRDNELFAENANRALTQWGRTSSKVDVTNQLLRR